MPPKKVCNVCCDTLKKPVVCGHCDFETCGSCASRFLLEGTIDAKCMNCKKPWIRKFLTDSFGKTFVSKKYKEKRENDLFETEKALMPETQEYAIRTKEIDAVNKEIYQLQNRLRELKIHKRILEAGGSISVIPKTHVNLSIKCPIGECRGFVNSATMVCGVCEGKLCKECREQILGDSHECNPDTVETVKLLKKDTKSCPSCKTSIHKIEGCDQMYCTQCHTAFSWRTGDIVLGERIHNPHYFEYLRTRDGGGAPPREVGDIPCGGIPSERAMSKYWKNGDVMNRLRLLVHVERVEFRNYRTDRVANNRDLRVKYINNEITEEQFKKSIQRRAKDVEKRREIIAVLNTLVVAGSDIMRNLNANGDVEMCISNFDALCEFVNKTMQDVSKLYMCVVPSIEGSMYIYTLKY